MKKLVLSIVAVLSLTFAANAANYTANEDAIDALIENCVEVSPLSADGQFEAFTSEFGEAGATAVFNSSTKNPITAFVLCTFLGGFGIHRHYMGTSKFMWAAYTFTFGGIFGIVTFVDWVMLIIGIIDEDIKPYIGNTKFIMWI